MAKRFVERLFDPRIKERLGRYIGQSVLAAVTILIITGSVQVLMRGYLVSSLGATTFVVFAMPKSRPATSRALVGGYLAGTLWGVAMSLLAGRIPPDAAPDTVHIVLGAISVGLAMCTMVVFNCEHPPAAGLALGYVMSPWARWTPLYVLLAIVLFAMAHRLFRNVLVDLA